MGVDRLAMVGCGVLNSNDELKERGVRCRLSSVS